MTNAHINRPSDFICKRCKMPCYTLEHLEKHKANCDWNRARTKQKTACIRAWKQRQRAKARAEAA